MAANAPSPLPRDVLTVGDGNFSFSLAFLRKHGAHVRLVATSFDSYEELVAKYPESAKLCAQLKELGATVLHRVDATNLQVSLRNAVNDAHHEEEQGGGQAVGPVHERFFDWVIFNHPHCGEENVARHQSLLSHFYVAAQRVLKRDGGRIHLTLAEGQPERWEARERARKAGLRVVDEICDVDNHDEYAVHYERKRHQNGKSFHRVLLHGERRQQVSTLFVLGVGAEKVQEEKTPDSSEISTISPDSSTTTRKRKLSDTSSADAAVPADGAGAQLVCEPCEKSFKTAQGLKTHIHMVHELGVAGSAPSNAKSSKLPCGQCDRAFRNEEARRQHQISKHGEDASIRPDWLRPLATPSASSTAVSEVSAATENDNPSPTTCTICGFQFADEMSFNEHWQELRPKTVVRRVCSLCGKNFEEERALRQHQNFCRVKSVEREVAAEASR